MSDYEVSCQRAYEQLVERFPHLLEGGMRVRLLRRGRPHPAWMTTTSTHGPGGTTRSVRVRFDSLQRNSHRTITERDLDSLEVRVGARYVPWEEA